ncbi:hypothetical protein [Moraxella lacunata]
MRKKYLKKSSKWQRITLAKPNHVLQKHRRQFILPTVCHWFYNQNQS